MSSDDNQHRQKRTRDGELDPPPVAKGKVSPLPPTTNEIAKLLGTGNQKGAGGALFGAGSQVGVKTAGPTSGALNLFETLGAAVGTNSAKTNTNKPAGMGALSGILSSINATPDVANPSGITDAGTLALSQEEIRPSLHEGITAALGNGSEGPLPLWLEARDTEPWDLPLMNLPKYSIAKPKGVSSKVYHPVNTMGPVPAVPGNAGGVKIQQLIKTPEEIRKERHHLRVQKQKELEEAYRSGEKERPADRLTNESLKTNLKKTNQNSKGKSVLKPTEMDALVQDQIRQRKQDHAQHNWEQHVHAVPQQKAKKAAGLKAASTDDPRVAVYYIGNLTSRHPLNRIQINCEQKLLKGKILYVPTAKYAVVLLWGGSYPMQFLDNLIQRRIDWPTTYGAGCFASVAFQGHSHIQHLPTVFVTPYYQGTQKSDALKGGEGEEGAPEVSKGGSGGAAKDQDGQVIPFQPQSVDPRTDAAHCTDVIEFKSTEEALHFCKNHECVEYWNAAAASAKSSKWKA